MGSTTLLDVRTDASSTGSPPWRVLANLNRMNDLVPGARVEGRITYRNQGSMARAWIPSKCGGASTWCSKGPTVSEVDLRQRGLRTPVAVLPQFGVAPDSIKAVGD